MANFCNFTAHFVVNGQQIQDNGNIYGNIAKGCRFTIL